MYRILLGLLHPSFFKEEEYSGDNIEKIWAHQLFAKQKTDVPKARKMVAGGLGSAVALPVGGRGQALKG